MKKIIRLLISMLMALTCLCACQTDSEKAVTIVYTNDTHTYINNQIKNDDGTTTPGLNFASVKALKDDLTAAGNRVILVDDGDFIQGTAYGNYDEGESIVGIMNKAGYDIATVGNHEFDYGFEHFEKILSLTDFSVVCSNLYNVQTNEPYIDAYKIIEKDGVKVGFIGVTTPDTMISVRSSTFQDENGNQLYTLIGYDEQQALYDLVQEKVDEIKNKVDYVVVLGHLGVSDSSFVTSYDLINNTNGIDLFIDGHSHTVMESELVKNNKNEDVTLTQTGSYLKNVGIATLSKNDGIKTELISSYDRYDDEVQALSDELVSKIEVQMGEVIGNNKSNLVIYDGDTRIVRAKETAISDFISDSYYYYMNEVAGIDTDIAVINGGGIRINLNQGLFTILDINTITPFGNILMECKIKGSDLKTYLNSVYSDFGENVEMENSVFFAGLKYELNASNNKVDNIEVYNKETNAYEPLDLEKWYSIAGYEFILVSRSDICPELANMEVVATYVCTDYLATIEYIKAFKTEDGLPTITTANSPLSKYTNYLMNYENYLGCGRMTVIK